MTDRRAGGPGSLGIVLTYLSRFVDNWGMDAKPVRTSIDMPRDLHRRVREAAARKGCSARKLILEGIEKVVAEAEPSRPGRRLDLDKNPPIPSAGRRLGFLTNEEIYDLIEFP